MTDMQTLRTNCWIFLPDGTTTTAAEILKWRDGIAPKPETSAALSAVGEPVAFRANVDGVWFVASTHKFMKATLEKSEVTAEIQPLYTSPPSVTALIAEIDAVKHYEGFGNYFTNVHAILDKYRSAK